MANESNQEAPKRKWGRPRKVSAAARGRPTVVTPASPQKHAANLDAARLSDTQRVPVPLVLGKRARRSVQPYTDSGPQMRQPKPHQTPQAPDSPEVADPRTTAQKNPTFNRLLRKRNAAAVSERKALRKAARQAVREELVAQSEELFLEKSWLDRKDDCLIAFGRAINEGANFSDA